jgi:hypothetical protein
MSSSAFRRHLEQEPELPKLLHRFVQALMVQIAQSTACNRAHGNERRCARWLLMTHDRVLGDEFFLTQEFLSQMLGVRRATVTEIASQLQREGLIEYTRGKMKVLDRKGLEAKSCECYGIVKDEYDLLLNGRPAAESKRTRIVRNRKKLGHLIRSA